MTQVQNQATGTSTMSRTMAPKRPSSSSMIASSLVSHRGFVYLAALYRQTL